MIWNTELQRLEFDDGSPVGALSLNDALAARGEPPAQGHLVVTPECTERSAATYAMGKKTIKKLLKLSHDGIAKNNRRSHSYGISGNVDYLMPGVYHQSYED